MPSGAQANLRPCAAPPRRVASVCGGAAFSRTRFRLAVTVGRRGKLLAAVVLTAAVVSAAAAVALDHLVARGEYDKADARLSAELSGAVETAEELRGTAMASAGALARAPAVQRALVAGDEQRLERLSQPGVSFETRGRRLTGAAPTGPLRGSAAVVAGEREVGRVVVGVPLQEIEAQAPLGDGSRLIWAGRACRKRSSEKASATARSPARPGRCGWRS